MTDSPKDEYRWEIFHWLCKQIKEFKVSNVVVVGDLTEKKDKHHSTLVNRLVEEFVELTGVPYDGLKFPDINILIGNHDFSKRVEYNEVADLKQPYCYPFFEFLSLTSHKIRVHDWAGWGISENSDGHAAETNDLFLPYGKFNKYEEFKKEEIKRIFIHDLVKGAEFGWGTLVENGLDKNYFGKNRVYAGHIHNPQDIGNITYVGSPYHVDFGDNYRGRVLLINEEDQEEIELFPDFLQKWKITIEDSKDLKDYELAPNDQLKVVIELKQENAYQYEEVKKEVKLYCEKRKIDLCGLELSVEKSKKRTKIVIDKKTEPVDIIKQFGEKEKLGTEYIKVAEELIG